MRRGWVLLLVSGCLSKPAPPNGHVPDGGDAGGSIDAVAGDCTPRVLPGLEAVQWSHPQLRADGLAIYGWSGNSLYFSDRATTADPFGVRMTYAGFEGPLCWWGSDTARGLICDQSGVHEAQVTGSAPQELSTTLIADALTATAAPGVDTPLILFVDSSHHLNRYDSGANSTPVSGPTIDSIALGPGGRVVYRTMGVEQMQVGTFTDHGLLGGEPFPGAPGLDDNHPAFTPDGRSIVFDRKSGNDYAIMEATCW